MRVKPAGCNGFCLTTDSTSGKYGSAADINLAGCRRMITAPPEAGTKEKISVGLAGGAGRGICRCPTTRKIGQTSRTDVWYRNP